MSKENIMAQKLGNKHPHPIFNDQQVLDLNFQQNIFQKTKGLVQDQIDNFKLFLMAGWLINFYIAAVDKSPMIDTPILNLNFTYRTWHWIDGISTLISVFFYLVVQETIRNDRVDAIKFIYNFQHPCRVIIAVILFLFKIGWIIIGIIMFLSFKLRESSDLLMNFVTIYYVGFVGGMLYFYHHFANKYIIKRLKKIYFTLYNEPLSSSIKRDQYEKSHGKDESDQKLSIYQVSNAKRAENIERQENITQNLQAKATSCMIFIAKNSTIYGFFWVINFVLYFKDQSQCMDQDYLNNQKLTYRKWNLAMGIIVLLTTLLNPAYNFFTLNKQYKLSEINRFFGYSLVQCVMNLFAYLGIVISAVFTIIGLTLFFKLDFEPKDYCSEQVKQFSIAFFLGLILVWAGQIFFLFEFIFMCCIKYK